MHYTAGLSSGKLWCSSKKIRYGGTLGTVSGPSAEGTWSKAVSCTCMKKTSE